jgi:serine/threonine-protein kinase
MAPQPYPRIVGRYALFDVIASGGMAAVHVGRLIGPVGFARTVAIKRLHENFAGDPEFVAMLLDEARLAARIRHPNVVSTLDIVADGKEFLLVMEYVVGESLMQLLRSARAANRPPPIPVVVDIMVSVLNGLHAAHEATDDHGAPLGIVHRDVSPHNILVGTDGSARVLDFGIAKATGRIHQTRGTQVKGKLRYMPAEQMLGRKVTRAADIYSTTVVLWEALVGQRLLEADNDAQVMYRVLEGAFPSPSSVRHDIPPELDEIVARGMHKEPEARYPTAKAMAHALEAAVPAITRSTVSDWVLVTVGDQIQEREARVAGVERSTGGDASLPIDEQSQAPARTTLPSGVTQDPSTLSPAGSVSRSVAPASSGKSRRPPSKWRQRVALVAAIGVVGGVALAWTFRPTWAPLIPPSSAGQTLLPPVARAAPVPAAAPSVEELLAPAPSEGLESSRTLDLDALILAAPSAAPSAPEPSKVAKTQRRLAPIINPVRAPRISARIYKRD